MILLTGGAGFIGSCFLKTLNNKGIFDVLVVDHLGSGSKWKNLIGKKFSAYTGKNEFIADIKKGKYKGKIEAIFHFGACSTTTELNADYLMDNNFNYSVELAKFAIEEKIKFVYASSAATYGNGENGYSDYVFDNLIPLNGYGFSKHIFDLWVLQNKFESKFVGIKFFNVFGPNEYHKNEMSSMVFKSFNQIMNTGKVRLFKSNSPEFQDGGQVRDFVYVKDTCETIWQMYINNIYGIYNLGTGCARSWNDLANAVFAALGKEPEIEYIDMPESLVSQYQNYTKADMSKLISTGISYKPGILEDSVNDYVNNYLVKNNLIY